MLNMPGGLWVGIWTQGFRNTNKNANHSTEISGKTIFYNKPRTYRPRIEYVTFTVTLSYTSTWTYVTHYQTVISSIK
jgi:hypothetical protein